MTNRQIIFDTETTGLDPQEGHRLIEIGCVELINRKLTGNNFHYYLNPHREIDLAAIKVHGLTTSFLSDKPDFADIAKEFLEYIKDAELVAHNAKFDLGFLNHELLLAHGIVGEIIKLQNITKITDSLVLAKKIHPGQSNSLDALCRRYKIDNQHRQLHGALLDSQLLAEVYLAMTGGQISLGFSEQEYKLDQAAQRNDNITDIYKQNKFTVLRATAEELQDHSNFINKYKCKN